MSALEEPSSSNMPDIKEDPAVDMSEPTEKQRKRHSESTDRHLWPSTLESSIVKKLSKPSENILSRERFPSE